MNNIFRIQKLQKSLENPLLIKKKENLLYLTGRSFMHGYLLVKPRPRNDAPALPAGREINAERRGRPSVVFLGDGLEKIEGLQSDFLKNVGKYIRPKETLEVFGEFTYAEVKYIKFKNPKLKLKVVIKHDPVDYLRIIKDREEIGLVKKSMEIVERVFVEVKKKLRSAGPRPALTEFQLAQFIQKRGLEMGANDLAFPAIVASGANASIPHHVPSSKKLKAGESIIIDFGFKYQNYCSDFTRTVFLKTAPRRLAESYNQVEKSYNGSMEFINIRSSSLRGSPAPGGTTKQSVQGKIASSKVKALWPRNDEGVIAGDVYQKSVDILKEKHLDKYFIHSLGHGTGLEIHELPNLSPNSKDILKNGSVFSIEPGVYIPKLGGIRIEDLVYLEGDKVKKFINVATHIKENIL